MTRKALAVTALLISPLNAQANCEHITFSDHLTLYGLETAKEKYDIDTVKREVCVQLKPMVQTFVIEPEQFCVAVDEDIHFPLWLKLPSGAGIDLSYGYSSEVLRPVYDYQYKVCIGRAGPMA